VRVSIDVDVRVGAWYTVRADENAPDSFAGDDGGGMTSFEMEMDTPGNSRPQSCGLELMKDMVEKAEPRVMAFDIECTKAKLKFPNAQVDQVQD
jgi:DNA polymerase epsilon subunit 1